MSEEIQSPQSSPEPSISSRKVPASRGKEWLLDAWKLFKLSPWAWISSTFVMFMILIILIFIPFVGLFATIVSAVFLGGLMLACQAQKSNEPVTINYLFKGFEIETANLLLAGLLYLGGTVLCSLLAFAASSTLGFEVMEVSPQELMAGTFDMEGYLKSLLMPLLFLLAFLIPLLMAFWFAPALIVLAKVKPVDAYKLSFRACNQNIGAFMIYGIFGFCALVVLTFFTQSFAMFLPLLALPVNLILNMAFLAIIIISIYTAFVDIFEQVNQEVVDSTNMSNRPSDPPDQLTL